MTPGEAIGLSLIKLRTNQRGLADMIGVSEGYISELRANKKVAGRDVALKFAELTAFPVEWFFLNTDVDAKEVETSVQPSLRQRRFAANAKHK